MKKIKTFPFKTARRVTKKEVLSAHTAIEKKLKKKRQLREFGQQIGGLINN